MSRDGMGRCWDVAGAESVWWVGAGLVSEVGGRVGRERAAGAERKLGFFENTKKSDGFLEIAVTCPIVDSYIDTDSLFHMDAKLEPLKPPPSHKILSHLHPKNSSPTIQKKRVVLPMHCFELYSTSCPITHSTFISLATSRRHTARHRDKDR